MTGLKPTFVYLIGMEDDEYTFPFTKIGVAMDVKHRLSNLNTGTPFNCFSFQEFPFRTRADALRAEKTALAFLGDRKVKGEWVHGRPEEVWPLVRHLLIDKAPRPETMWDRLERTPKPSLWDPIAKRLKTPATPQLAH